MRKPLTATIIFGKLKELSTFQLYRFICLHAIRPRLFQGAIGLWW